MKKNVLHVFSNQHGSVINVALLILILIFLIGIGLSKMSSTDIKIASNIKQDMTTFYEADAALEATGELIEQNLACITGFDDTSDKDRKGVDLPVGEEIISGMFYVSNMNFSHDQRDEAYIPDPDPAETPVPPGKLLPDFYYPADYGDPDKPHASIKVGGTSRFSKGSAIQMAAGYEGLGKGAAAGGASIIYDVYARRIGLKNTSSIHFMQWVHLIKPSGGCNF
jgi:hypothetical protein